MILAIALGIILALVLVVTAPLWVPLVGCLVMVLLVIIIGLILWFFDPSGESHLVLLSLGLLYYVLLKFDEVWAARKKKVRVNTSKSEWEARDPRNELLLQLWFGLPPKKLLYYAFIRMRPALTDKGILLKGKTLKSLQKKAAIQYKDYLYLKENNRKNKDEKIRSDTTTALTDRLQQSLIAFKDAELITINADDTKIIIADKKDQVLINFDINIQEKFGRYFLVILSLGEPVTYNLPNSDSLTVNRAVKQARKILRDHFRTW